MPNFSEQLRNSVEKLRSRLLDTTGRNPSISFKHKAGSKKQLRLIDEVPDFLFAQLLNMKEFEIKGVEVPDLEPEDEKTEIFKKILKSALKSDEKYLSDLEAQGESPSTRAVAGLEGALRDRLRVELKLPLVSRNVRPNIKV